MKLATWGIILFPTAKIKFIFTSPEKGQQITCKRDTIAVKSDRWIWDDVKGPGTTAAGSLELLRSLDTAKFDLGYSGEQLF